MSSQFSVFSRSIIRALTTVVMLSGASIFSAIPAAAQWQITPSASAGINYGDNIRLNFNSLFEESVPGWALEGDAKFDYVVACSTGNAVDRHLHRHRHQDDDIANFLFKQRRYGLGGEENIV